MTTPAGRGRLEDPAATQAAIERFLNSSRQPVLLEPGEDHFPLIPGSFRIHSQGGRILIEVWDEDRNLTRRIAGVRAEGPGKLELTVEKFPRRQGKLILVDLARPSLAGVVIRERRLCFRERFRRLLCRQFPSWRISELSVEMDLEHSLSARYPRALLTMGRRGLAALGVPPQEPLPGGALSFGLVWLDYLRRRETQRTVEGLALFLPVGAELATCLRLRWLDPALARWQAWVYSPEDHAAPVDLADYGNVDTRLEPLSDYRRLLSARVLSWVDRISAAPGVESLPNRDGSVSLCVRGLEFAWAGGGRMEFGLTRRHTATEANLAEMESMARELVRLRSPDAADRENALYRLRPEQWLASQVRNHLQEIDASLLPAPLYGQVPAMAGGDRGVLDLLAADTSGRLAVLELKASEDIHLPLQALDYWIRVEWHLRRGEFTPLGYFPGLRLSTQPPRLVLIAPALEFHPATERILQWFSPCIPVERIGVGVEWRRRLETAFRLQGRGSPCRC